MDLYLTVDPDEIYKVFSHPDIWPLLSKRDPDKALIPLREQDIYLMIYANGVLVGCTYFEVLNGYELEMHPYVLPQHRKKHSYEAVKSCMDWSFGQAITRILVNIPDEFPRVQAFARRMGFEDIGNNTLEMRSNKWAA